MVGLEWQNPPGILPRAHTSLQFPGRQGTAATARYGFEPTVLNSATALLIDIDHPDLARRYTAPNEVTRGFPDVLGRVSACNGRRIKGTCPAPSPNVGASTRGPLWPERLRQLVRGPLRKPKQRESGPCRPATFASTPPGRTQRSWAVTYALEGTLVRGSQIFKRPRPLPENSR